MRKTIVALAAVAATIAVTSPAQASPDPESTFQPTGDGVLAVVNNTTSHAATYRIKVFCYYSDGGREVSWYLQAFRLRPGGFRDVVVPFSEACALEPAGMNVQTVRRHWGVVGMTSRVAVNPNTL